MKEKIYKIKPLIAVLSMVFILLDAIVVNDDYDLLGLILFVVFLFSISGIRARRYFVLSLGILLFAGMISALLLSKEVPALKSAVYIFYILLSAIYFKFREVKEWESSS